MSLQVNLERARPYFDRLISLTDAERAKSIQALAREDRELAELVRQLVAAYTPEETPDYIGTDGNQSPLIGQRVGQYVIQGELGRGNMGGVYLARGDQPRREVAIKIIERAGESPQQWSVLVRRFQRESEILAKLAHPGIVPVFDAGQESIAGQQRPFFVMERIIGLHLTDYAVAHRLDIPKRLTLMAEIADAVQYAHFQGVTHRDLKPGNILVDSAGRPRICDFGIARVDHPEIAGTLSDERSIVGTLPYMSPEQAAGDPAGIDSRTDVYALGAIAYEILCGRPPLELRHKLLPEKLRTIQEDEPPSPSRLNGEIRRDAEKIVQKALAKLKGERYPTAAEFAADIRRFLANEPIHARQLSLTYQLSMFAKRHRTLVAASAAALLFLIIGLFGTEWGRRAARTAEANERKHRNTAEAALAEVERQRWELNEVAQLWVSGVDWAALVNRPGDGGPDGVAALVDRSFIQPTLAAAETEFAERPHILASVRSSAAAAYQDLGELPAAEREYRAALALRLRQFGPQHPDVAATRSNLGNVLLDRRMPQEAEPLLAEAVDVLRKQGPEWNSDLASAIDNLARARSSMGQLDAAEALFAEASSLRETTSPPDDPRKAASMNNTAYAAYLRGDYAAAEDSFRRVLREMRAATGARSPQTAVALNNLANTLRVQGRAAEAIPLLREALAIYRERAGTRREIPNAENSLGLALFESGQAAAAEPVHRSALASWKSALSPGDPYIAVGQCNLARAIIRLGKLDEAQNLLLESHATLSNSIGDPPNALRPVLVGLTELYDELEKQEPGKGHAASAAKWRDALMRWQASTQPAGNGEHR